MSYSTLFFTTIFRRVLKKYFAQKQWKADFSKNIWKEENHGQHFGYVLIHCISMEKKALNSSGLGTCKVGKKVSFWPNFDFFCNIRAAWKGK